MVKSVLRMTLKELNIIQFRLLKVLIFYTMQIKITAEWQSGYAAACKAVNAGSIPASASMVLKTFKYLKV